MVEETMIPVDKLTTTAPKSKANYEMIVNMQYFPVAYMINPLLREPAKAPLTANDHPAKRIVQARLVDKAEDRRSR